LAIAERGEKQRTPAANLLSRGLTGCRAMERLFTTMLLIFSIVPILRQPGHPP
jgi:hypothetical protein